MLQALLAGAVAGYAIAIPVGAIAVLIIHTGITDGLRHALAAGAGAASADAIYATLAVLAGLGLSSIIGPLETPLRIVGGALLMVIGARGLVSLRSARGSDTGRHVPRTAHSRTYLTVLGLTLLNPATVVYFAALAVGLPFLSGLAERLAFAAAAFTASLSWQSLLAVFGATVGRGAGHRLHGPTVLLGNAIVLLIGALILLAGVGALG